MRSEPETPHVAHGTGKRWLDLTLSLSAMFVSLVSLALAVLHGNAMDRLVAANSWPFLMYSTDNMDPQGNRRISLKVENAGVGPARIQTFEVWWQGQPVASAPELLRRCCMTDSGRPIDAPTVRSVGLAIGQIPLLEIRLPAFIEYRAVAGAHFQLHARDVQSVPDVRVRLRELARKEALHIIRPQHPR